MQLCHTRAATSVRFDDPNLVSAAGLVPVLALADAAGLASLADEHLSVPGDKGANAGLKVASLVAGMVAGADSIDDMALLRHGGMGRVFERAYAPSTLGSFLRSFTFGHVRQLDAVASRFLTDLAAQAGQAPQVTGDGTGGSGAGRCRRHDHRGPRVRQAGRRVRLLRGPRPERAAGHRHHRGLGAGGGGAAAAQGIVRVPARRETAGRRRAQDRQQAARYAGHGKPLLRADSAFYGAPTVGAAVRGGAEVSVTVRLDPKVKAAIATIGEDAWTPIEYTDAVYDEASRTGCRGPRSPRCPSPRSPPRRPPNRCPAGWWCAASRT